MSKMNAKKRKATGIAWIMIILVIAIAIPLNLIANKLDMNFDMTPKKLYSLSDTTTDYLDELDESGDKIDFYFLMKMDTLETSDDYIALYNMLKQYSKHKCINFVDFDPDENPELVDSLNPDGYLTLSSGDIVIKHGSVTKRVTGKSMYRNSGSYDDSGNYTSGVTYFEGENLITGAIKAAVSDITPKVYFLSGHGEPTIEDNFTKLSSNLSNYNYSAEELDLSTVDAVPDDAAILVEASPEKDITDSEKEMIDEFLDNGGNITFMMSPNKSKQEYKNIEAIMEDYCIGMHYDRVKETNNSLHLDGDAYAVECNLTEVSDSDEEGSSESSQYVDIMTVNDSYAGDVDLTSGLISNGLYTYMPESRSFYFLYNDNLSTMDINTLITTNTTAEGEPYGGTEDDPDVLKDTTSGLCLSAYSMDKSRNDSKIVCFGSADFLKDENMESGYYINPLYLFLSSVSWMQSSDIDMGIASKEEVNDKMHFENEASAKTYMAVFMAIPVVVAAVGLGVWIKRRKA